MKINTLPYLTFLLFLVFMTAGCEKNEDDYPDPEKLVFNFVVNEGQRDYINTSRGEQYEITDPVPLLELGGDTYTIDRFEIRGDGSLYFRRKSFGLNMDKNITLYNPYKNEIRKYEEFKLLAMVFDFTYIENSVATGLLRLADLWPVYSFFTEVRLDNHTQGLYHFIEDPFEYFMEKENAAFVVRRGYDHVIKACAASRGNEKYLERNIARFKKIYSNLPLYSGKQVYDTLSAYIDLEQYFAKLSVDLLMKNGDYTDEVIFYTKVRNGREILGVFPWDLDDIFSDQPHEIGNPWATGTVFGTREYYTMDDVVADVGSKLLYSVEDDLDYKIAKDEFLYNRYLEILESIINKIDNEALDDVCDYTLGHIGPFYSNDSIIQQSAYDADETSYSLFISNLAEKRQMLKDRRTWIMGELGKQKK